tara:strand:+ start:1608 stop:1874 length:267 start_codon:yes stop_codon:yes gene_type:complete
MSRQFLGTCDRVRRTSEGEAFWVSMMAERVEISERLFLESVRVNGMLDDGETFQQFTDNAEAEGDACRFFQTGEVFHIQQCGFEWIFK